MATKFNRIIDGYIAIKHIVNLIIVGGGIQMLWTIILVLLALWLIGAVAGFLGNIIHILLAVALILIIVRLVQGKKIL